MIRIWNTNKLLIRKAVNILAKELKCSNIKVSITKPSSKIKRNKEVIEIKVNSSQKKKRIIFLLSKIRNTRNKRIISNFLRGFFDAEASIDFNGNIVIWQTKSKKGKDAIKLVLRSLKIIGINFKLWKNEKFFIIAIKGSKNNVENLIKFQKLVGFSHNVKAKKLKKLIEILKNRQKIDKKEIIDFIMHKKQINANDLIFRFNLLRTEAHRILKEFCKIGLLRRKNKHIFEIA